MTKRKQIEQQAFLVMSDFAFLWESDNNGKPVLLVINLNKVTQVLKCRVYGRHIRLRSTNMSETNKYKVLLYIERNKDMILRNLGV